MEGRFVSYLRVSTARQGKSGLGLEAQRKAVADYLNGGHWELLAEYVEVESGKRNDRPKLQKALQHCKATGATLVIAKLDRLSRDAHFLLGLQKSSVRFVAADIPDANEMTVGILAVIAQHERKLISERTKAALAMAKERGVKLGNPNGAAHLQGLGNDQAVKAIKEKAQLQTETVLPIIADIQAQGHTSIRAIAQELTRQGVLTPRGNRVWHPTGVARLLKRVRS